MTNGVGSFPSDSKHSFDFGPPAPVFSDKLKEREYVKERLALAYRILAREGICTPAPLKGCHRVDGHR